MQSFPLLATLRPRFGGAFFLLCSCMPSARYRGPPMTLANMRANGVRSLAIRCELCHHEAGLNVDRFYENVPVPSFGPRMVCTSCGIIGAFARPNWREQPLMFVETYLAGAAACAKHNLARAAACAVGRFNGFYVGCRDFHAGGRDLDLRDARRNGGRAGDHERAYNDDQIFHDIVPTLETKGWNAR